MILRLLFTSFLCVALLRLVEKIPENNKLFLLGDWALVQITVYFKINGVIGKGQAQIFCCLSWDLYGSNTISSQSV